MAEKKPISELIETALTNIKEVVDSGTIIGEPINTVPGTTIIPVSRVSIGIASGGAEYQSKSRADIKTPNFGGGGGTGISVTPVCFLVISADGQVRLLNVDGTAGYPGGSVAGAIAAIDEIIDKAPAIMVKIKDIFSKKSPDESKDAQ